MNIRPVINSEIAKKLVLIKPVSMSMTAYINLILEQHIGADKDTNRGKTVISTNGTRIYNNEEKLVGIIGNNKNGEMGKWLDDNGLCEHERVSKWCEDCK